MWKFWSVDEAARCPARNRSSHWILPCTLPTYGWKHAIHWCAAGSAAESSDLYTTFTLTMATRYINHRPNHHHYRCHRHRQRQHQIHHYRAILCTMQCIARTMLSQDVCQSVCSFVCHMPAFCRTGLAISSNFFHHRVATPFYFFRTNRMVIFRRTPLMGASNAGGMKKSWVSANVSL